MVDDVQIVGKTLLDLLLKQCLGTKLGKWFMQKHQTSPCFSVVETRAHQSTSTPKALCRTTFRWQKWPFTKDIMKQKHTLKTNKQILVGSFNPGMFKKCWKIPRRFSCKTPKQKSQSHQDPSAQAHGKAIQSSFTLRERWTQVTYFWTFFLSCCLFWRFQFSIQYCNSFVVVKGDVCQLRSSVHGCLKGTNGTKELTKLNDLLWNQSYWDTFSQTQTANADRVCMTILWNGGTAVWWYDPSSMSHVALPWVFARILAVGRGGKLMTGLMDLSVRLSYVKEIHDTCGKENYIIYWSEISVPFRRHLETVSCFSCFFK